MKRILKMIKWILLGLLALIIILVIVWFFISSGKIRTYTEPNSLSEKFVMDINTRYRVQLTVPYGRTPMKRVISLKK